MSKHSVSTSDLYKSPRSTPIKHPAFIPLEFPGPGRNCNTLPVGNGLRHRSSIPAVFRYPGETPGSNRSLREASKSLMSIHEHNYSPPDSDLDSQDTSRSIFWSTTSLPYYKGVPTPQIKNKHLFCQIPGMNNPKRRLSKSPSIDSGTGSGSGSMRRKHPISPTRKRRGSSGSASSTSSSGFSGAKDKTEESPEKPLEAKKKSAFSALISRKPKSPSKKASSGSGVGVGDGSLASGPSSPTPSSSSSAKVSSIRESLRAAKNLLTHSSKINTEGPKSASPKISDSHVKVGASVNTVTNTTLNSRTVLPPAKPVRSNSWRADDSSPSPTLLSPTAVNDMRLTMPSHAERSATLPPLYTLPEKKSKEGKSGKKGLGKFFSKKNKSQEMLHKSIAEPIPPFLVSHNSKQTSAVFTYIYSFIFNLNQRKSPDIVNFESEPKKLLPKSKGKSPKATSVGETNKGYNEMEVSEEAVAMARKLREQREEEMRKLKKIEETSKEGINLSDSANSNLRHEPLAPLPNAKNQNSTETKLQAVNEKLHEATTAYLTGENCSGESGDETLDLTKELGSFEGKKLETAGEQRQKQVVRKLDSGISELAEDGGRIEEARDSSHAESPNVTTSPQILSNNEEMDEDERNTSSLSKHELESGIGNESPMSSLDEQEQLAGMCESPNHSNQDRHTNSGQFTDGEAETEVDDDEDTSLATTVTTTASEMDASFMLSRSLALTEDEFSYTESFKQLKPFQFDHVEPILEGKRERLYKVLVVGELGTGKTSIIKRYVHQFFSQHYRATIGVDFALKVLRWDNETVVRLQLWDIAGQERFGSMTRVYYKEAVGAFVVFDVTRAATLEAVPKWKADLDAKVVLPDGRPIPTVLLANKSDQPKEGIAANRDKMNEFCQQQGFSAWFETSAKDNINIDESANFLVSKILEMDKWSQEPLATDPEKLDLSANGKHKAGSSGNCSC
ncbi:unnamed protein product [Allacma fusca]|uniref:Uncharacterized protein n=1 Tax=Allacma fusca TaxID=39272 RepID=A0A8J2LN68_9HEXA|nr:unnamed protein product [Allacma fusca]